MVCAGGMPAIDGPHKTLYNRFVRWSAWGIFDNLAVKSARLTA